MVWKPKDMSVSGQRSRSTSVPVLIVRTEDGRTFRFSRPFQIGRERECDVHIDDPSVSRRHVLVSFASGQWWVRDQQSGNGVFVEGDHVGSASIESSLTIRLGPNGPSIEFQLESREQPVVETPVAPRVSSPTMIAQRYFGSAASDEVVGGQTMMIRKAFQKVHKRQKRTYQAIVAALAAVALAALGYAWYGQQQLAKQQALAEDLFYQMKAHDVEIANLERQLLASNNSQGQNQVEAYLARRRQMQTNYEQFISGLKLYDHALTPKEQLILRVTPLFGECEMAAPPEYLAEVNSYIRKWQSTGRYAASVSRAQQMGYVKRIIQEFERQDLPPQFFYLAMQESGFDEVASGPPTRWGIAKGMWQFVPDTAKRYGLTVGPLVAYPRADPADDRHKWENATRAAAAYIKEIYATDAQASGLLVMASYNWGENRVINLLRKMPANPRERNFWKVLERHRDQVPKQTYDYVLSIVSAAVIGENPRLFGFGFDIQRLARARPQPTPDQFWPPVLEPVLNGRVATNDMAA